MTLERAEWELTAGDGLKHMLQFHIWAAIRDPQKVLAQCPSAWGSVFEENHNEIGMFINLAQVHYDEATKVVQRLGETNRRCASNPEFCNRSNVRKSVFATIKGDIKEDVARASGWRNTVLGICDVKAYDSIAGWCACEKKAAEEGYVRIEDEE